MPNEIHSYSELQHQIHEGLRIQHPNWVEPNGECPTCDSSESRLVELLGLAQRSNAVRVQPIPVLGHADDH
jgi:hypothetical protein